MENKEITNFQKSGQRVQESERPQSENIKINNEKPRKGHNHKMDKTQKYQGFTEIYRLIKD